MATAVFNKYITVKYDTTNYPADTRNVLVRTFNDSVVTSANVPDPTQIFVSYNGQRINRRTSETAGTFSRFYYEITAHTTSSFTVNIFANSSYTLPGYTGGATLTFQIEDNDLFFIDYTHTVTL